MELLSIVKKKIIVADNCGESSCNILVDGNIDQLLPLTTHLDSQMSPSDRYNYTYQPVDIYDPKIGKHTEMTNFIIQWNIRSFSHGDIGLGRKSWIYS